MRNSLFGTVAAAGLLALPALAQAPEDGGEKSDPPRREEMRERIVKQYDIDGDGKLSDDERRDAREAMREVFGGRGPEGPRGPEADRGVRERRGPRDDRGPADRRRGREADRGPDGRRGPGGPAAPPPPPPPDPEMLFNRFDADESDSLSRDEFVKLAQFVREHHPGTPGGPRSGGPRFDRRGPGGPPPDSPGEFRRRDRGPDGRPPGADRPRRNRDEWRRDRPRPPRPDGPPGPPPTPEGAPEEAI